ncbi:MAG: methylmalonyl-CoA mutase family protein [Actinomycetota bacterium]
MTNDDRFQLDEAPATETDWREAVDRVLKGRPFEKVLVSQTQGGLDIQPLYHPSDTPRMLPVDTARVAYGWDLRQRHEARDLESCRLAVLDDLEHGVSSIELGSLDSRWTLDALRTALQGVLLDIAPVALSPHADVDAAQSLLDLIDERGDAATSRSWLGLDPIGEFARSGVIGDLDGAASLVASVADTHPQVIACTIDTTRYVDGGADEVQELGWMLASGVALLRALEAAGLSPEAAAARIGFRVTADANQFLTIARLRAARQLWTSVLNACGVEDPATRFQAVTSAAMFSRRDPEVNMLRSTAAAFGAGVGGADSITVLPFDGSSSALARRNARNIQHLLIDESGINRLVDPAAGSGFVESLTGRLLEAGWAAFQQVEAEGGMVAALESGSVEAAIDASWHDRLGRLATRMDPVTGVSEFPDDGDPTPAAEPAGGFPLRRSAAPFEALRDAADRAETAPTVHLAALGPLAEHTARSTWITNLLAVGGIVADGGDADGAATPADAATALRASGQTLAVICSSDSVYAHDAAAAAAALKAAGATFVALAGHPGDLRADLETAGVDAFFHVGVDVLAALGDLHDRLGVS